MEKTIELDCRQVLYSDIRWGEAPRWHCGKLWFSDIFGKKVKCIDLDGKLQDEIEVSGMPIGLGWLPEGDFLIVAGEIGLMRWMKADRRLVTVSELRKDAIGVNDMAVDRQGRAYVGCYGYDIKAFVPGMDTPAWIALVKPDGTVRKMAEELKCPNGMVLTPDEKNLIVADTFRKELVVYDVQPDGALSNCHVWASVGYGPDGIAMVRDGTIWAAFPDLHQVIHLKEGGEILARCHTQDRPLACEIGGKNEEILFIVTVPDESGNVEGELCNPQVLENGRTSKIFVCQLPVPRHCETY